MTLDLCAVRERTGMLKAVAEGNPVVRATVADLEGLDTHCRALRVALLQVAEFCYRDGSRCWCNCSDTHWDKPEHTYVASEHHDYCQRAAAVLAQGRDE